MCGLARASSPHLRGGDRFRPAPCRTRCAGIRTNQIGVPADDGGAAPTAGSDTTSGLPLLLRAYRKGFVLPRTRKKSPSPAGHRADTRAPRQCPRRTPGAECVGTRACDARGACPDRLRHIPGTRYPLQESKGNVNGALRDLHPSEHLSKRAYRSIVGDPGGLHQRTLRETTGVVWSVVPHHHRPPDATWCPTDERMPAIRASTPATHRRSRFSGPVDPSERSSATVFGAAALPLAAVSHRPQGKVHRSDRLPKQPGPGRAVCTHTRPAVDRTRSSSRGRPPNRMTTPTHRPWTLYRAPWVCPRCAHTHPPRRRDAYRSVASPTVSCKRWTYCASHGRPVPSIHTGPFF